MEDCSASIMTIEFLRARLLAERSVSKAARQRADELQNRLGQLQDQLNFISLERQNTENATSQLLSRQLLSDEDAFHSDLSSTTEEELEEEEEEELGQHPSVDSKACTNQLTKRPSSLSWKPSSKDTTTTTTTRTNSIQKRDFRSFSSIRSPSPKHPSAKSCRKIGRRQTSSPKEEFNAVIDKNMERALEHQAQLIGRYQEEEKAQRDWEHNFRETNKDTNEPGNQSDITEEIYDTKVGCGAPIVSENQNVASGAITVSFNQPEYACAGSKLEQRGSDSLDYESVPSEEGLAKEEQAQKQSEIYSHHPSSHDHPRGKGKLDSLLKPSASFMSSSIHEGSHSFSLRSENERNRIVVHKPAVEVVGVLEALEAAKSSIEQRLGRLPPLLEGGFSSSSRVDMPPVGCAGLFRIPSDTKSKLEDSSARLNLTTSHPADDGNLQTAGGRMNVVPSLLPHMGSRSNVLSSSDGFMGSPYRERVWKENANGYNENYPRYPGFPDLNGGMQSSNEGIVRSLMSPPEQFTFYGGGVRPNNMYK